MSAPTPGLPITKPVSVWNKPLNADFKELFKSLGKAAISGVTGQWPKAGADLVDAAAAVGFESDPGQLAWLLIRSALAQATLDLVQDSADLLVGDPLPDPDELGEQLDLSLEETALTLDATFFEHPAHLGVLDEFKVPFKQWLCAFGLSEAQATMVAARLPTYFVHALNHEWVRRPKVYEPLKEAVDTPFTTAAEREQAWGSYYAGLRRQVDESMFSEAFSLAHVYVRLRAYHAEKADDGIDTERFEARTPEEAPRRIVADAEYELCNWVTGADKDDAVRVMSGGPGSGKSSFARMFCARQTDTPGLRVLFIPLHQFDPAGDLETAVGNFVRMTDILPYNPLDPDEGEPRLLLVFDGLDELTMQGKAAAETAQQFVREVDRTVTRRNYGDLKVQVVISGRELAVQANATEWRKPGQILHLLPYFVSDSEDPQYHDPNGLLAEDQRQTWWRRYGEATGRDHAGMPDELTRNELDEITAQPLLNYLVALSHGAGRIDFSRDVNLNVIYADLLQGVYERRYAGHRRVVREIEHDDFVRVLEEIALAAWHGDGRTATVREIEDHCADSGLSGLLAVFQEGAKAGVTRLLTAFYFREHGRRVGGDPTFEFTHKSFGEYLTGRRLVRGIARIQEELAERANRPDYGWDERGALEHWARMSGTTALDADVMAFIRNEVRVRPKDAAAQWQMMLCRLIGFMLRHGMPMERLGNPSFHESARQARNAEEALLALLSVCAERTRETSHVDWPDRASAGAWIRRLQGQRNGQQHGVVLASLCFLGLQGAALPMSDLYGANLRSAHLGGADLQVAILGRANLRGANLARAVPASAWLVGADLQRADLQGACLAGANLQHADLRRADLQGADLQGANLQDANLEGANLEGANLEGANVRRTQLE